MAEISSVSKRLLSLAHLSLIESPPVSLVEIAAEEGFDMVDLRLSPATPADRRYSLAERMALCRDLVPVLRSSGIRVWDVEIIRLNANTLPQEHLGLLEAAAMLGARRVKVVADTNDHRRVANLLAELCVLAHPFGLTLDLEYMVFSGVRSLKAAVAIVAAAEAPNLAVLVDALHWMRAGEQPEDVAATDRAWLGYVQLCDGTLVGSHDREALILEARTARLAPGEGQFPLTALLRAMPSDCVVSLEVPLRPGSDPSFHARRLLQCGRALLETV